MLEILSKKKKEEIQEELEKNYQVSLPSFQLVRQAKDRLRIFTGNLSEREINFLASLVRIETVGLYFAFVKNQRMVFDRARNSSEFRHFKEQEFRVGFDSCFLFKEAKKNVFELNEEQARKWLAGEDLNLDLENIDKNNFTSNFVFLRYKEDVVGCGKFVPSQNKILNFVPKERRIKY